MNLPNKKYNTIVLDPPWDISMSGSVKIRINRKKKLDYKTMTLKEIKQIPLRKIANVGSHIYCWTTNKMLPYTFDVLKEWGVNYHLSLVWNKPNGMMPCFGYKFATEFCILGFYQKPMQKFIGMAKLNHFLQPSKKPHSTKPGCFFDLVDKMSPSPKLEMFARERRFNWDSFGDEV